VNGSSQIDPDGLPLPDAEAAENCAAKAREALTARPKASDWAVLVASLYWAVEADRRAIAATNAPPGSTAARIALKAVIQFLEKQPCVMQRGASMPLIELQGALVDLAAGRVSQLLKPIVKPPYNPGKGHHDSLRMGMAAKAMSLLMDGGIREDAAALRVARAIGIESRTVRNWRNRLKEGPGPGAPQEAVRHYKEALPPWPGSTPIQQAERVLELLRARMPVRTKSQEPPS
jgi:hypothetical protein